MKKNNDQSMTGSTSLLTPTEVQLHVGELLNESAEILRQVVKHDPYAIAIYDCEMRYLAASDHWLIDYNVKEDDIIGKLHYDVFPEIPQRWRDIHQRCLAGAIERNDDDYFERPDGSITYNRWEMRPWHRSDGTIGGVITYTEVTTERKLAEKARKEIIERYDLATRTGGLGVWDWDIKKNQMIWDDRMYELFGISKNEFLASYEIWLNSIHPEDKTFAKEESQRALRGESEYNTEFRVVWPNGNIRHIRSSAHIVRDSDNLPLRQTGISYDITERKQAEEERLKLESQLQQSQKLESLGMLAGGIAHDFNNLMGGLFGYIEVAQRVAEKLAVSDITPHLNKAMEALERARELTRQLLTFSKGGVPSKKPTNVSTLLKDVANVGMSGSSLAVHFEISDDLWLCEIDSNQIFQALDNILINAKDAMPDGGSIYISAENIKAIDILPRLLAAGRYVRISIVDNGPGISEKDMLHLFDPFFTTKVKGHGLGLTMAYSIVTQHGGMITVESSIGKGATFHIYLPATLVVPIAEPLKIPIDAHQGKGKILLMDDEIMILDVTASMLERMGYVVTKTKTGEEAIHIYKEALESAEPFKAAIIDLTVRGGMGGKEAIKRLLELDPEIKAIVASGYSDDPVTINPKQYGFKVAIMKPYQFTDLVKILSQVLCKKDLEN